VPDPGERVVVWIPSGDPGWDLEAARPYETRSLGGGLRTLYELAAALVTGGRPVELRGVYSPPDLAEVCEAAGAWPELPRDPRPPAASDTVIVPEGIDDPEVHARLVLSPARAVLMLLGPPGVLGWPFADGWSPPDPVTMEIGAAARAEHFRAAAGLGYELWTHTPGLQRAAEAAGVPCRIVGNGVPGRYPAPAHERDIDVAWLPGNRWAPLARPAVRSLEKAGARCVAVEDATHREVLELFGRARVVLHPLRVEGHSRIGCEARAMGAVPVVLSSSPFSVGLDEAGGAVAVDDPAELAGAVTAVLADPDRLARLSAAGMRSAREQVDWDSFVRRAGAACAGGAGADPARSARAAIGARLRDRQAGLELELERHARWLESTNSSLSWRATAPLRRAAAAVRGQAA
jgi:hypothetical protein